jgi:hypothetical protein
MGIGQSESVGHNCKRREIHVPKAASMIQLLKWRVGHLVSRCRAHPNSFHVQHS